MSPEEALVLKGVFVCTEGLAFGLMAMGVFVSFRWLRFPDLTPDASFTMGAIVYVMGAEASVPPVWGLLLAIAAGALSGVLTGIVNRAFRVPAVVSGLLIASALYSVGWIVMGKPNQPLSAEHLVAGAQGGLTGAVALLSVTVLLSVVVVLALMRFAVTIWGIRLRAIGENPGIAMDLGVSASGMTIQALALANGTVGLAGALFAQRSYSADISMGIGMTITGLAGMTLGLVVAGNDAGPGKSLAMIVVGAIVYKALVFLALEIGAPGEAFRLLSSAVILLGFLLAARSRSDFLRGLRWN